MWKIYKEESSDLRFAIGCLFLQAINLNEFRQWVEVCINDLNQEEIPLYMFDLMDFEDSLAKIHLVIGFVPSTGLSKTEKIALEGISYLRGVDIFDPISTREKSIECLKKNPHISEKFKRFFPFINFI
ncbi:hypothetical protein ABTM59_18105 [Acinetobacter baumannii]|jgi:hypothetical protein|uniref:hypothetical protein n=1 Tax=Acinetobacter baumannii TaxID=470 RepID=UPI000D69F928|nr:hypothetical protein [Acinetobacter baumannii]